MAPLETLFLVAFASVVGAAAMLTVLIVGRQLILTIGAAGLPASTTTEHTRTPTLGPWPRVAVIVPAHNEEAVIGDSLRALLRSDYPRHLFEIIVVNDRSVDGTAAIIDAIALRDPCLRPLHRQAGAIPGKSAALADAIAAADDADVFVFFDADYLPAPELVRELVAPFADPEIGATMGRVVPVNADANLLTRLIDLERRAGYVIDQQMRERWGLLPQFGGTVGAVRAAALDAVGGWDAGLMAEDTDLTYRLFLNGFDVAYLNSAACYEETPEDWQARYKQVRRWAYGHNQCLIKYLGPTLRATARSWPARLDAALVLTFYLYPVVALAALPLAVLAPAFLGTSTLWLLLPLVPLFCGFGNLAPFFQIVAAAWKDRQPHVLATVPLLPVSAALTMLAAAHAMALLLADRCRRKDPVWDKTKRFRSPMELPMTKAPPRVSPPTRSRRLVSERQLDACSV